MKEEKMMTRIIKKEFLCNIIIYKKFKFKKMLKKISFQKTYDVV